MAWQEVVASRCLVVRNMGRFTMRMKARVSSCMLSIAIDKTLLVVLDIVHKVSKEKEGVVTSHTSAI
jgi:hypothetical protein